MTINKKDTVNLPKWLVILLFPLIIGGLGGLATSMYSAGRTSKQIEINTILIKDVQTEKANKEDLIKVENTLIRIETKLDNHITNTRNGVTIH